MDLFGTQVKVEVRIGKKTGKYSVKILDHGEEIGCTEIDGNGENINEKIVKYIAQQIGNASTPELTKQGEMETRQSSVTFNPLEETEEGYDPLEDSPVEEDPWDAGGFGV